VRQAGLLRGIEKARLSGLKWRRSAMLSGPPLPWKRWSRGSHTGS